MSMLWMQLSLWLLVIWSLDAGGLCPDPPLAAPAPREPSNKWIMLNDVCLMFGDISKNWTEAREACRSLNADLASLPSSVQAAPLISMLSVASPYWVGYQSGPGQTGWLDGSPDSENPFPPNSSEHCGSVLVAGNGTHSFLDWELRLCSLPYLYLCMKVDGQGIPATTMTVAPPTMVTPTVRGSRTDDTTLGSQSDATDSSSQSGVTSSTSNNTTRATDFTSGGQNKPATILDDVTDGLFEMTSEYSPVTVFVERTTLEDDILDRNENDITSMPPCPVWADCVDMVLDRAVSLDDKIRLLSMGMRRDAAFRSSDVTRSPASSDDDDDDWRRRIEYFFWVLNRYLTRSHGGHANRELEQVLSTLDDFMGQTVQLVPVNETLKGSYSYVEFQIVNIAQSELSSFTFRDNDSVCNISQVGIAGAGQPKKHEKNVLVTVVMNIPDRTINVKLGDQTADGVLPSPVVLFSGFVNGRRRSYSHSFSLHQRVTDDSPNNTHHSHCVYLDTKAGTWSTYGCEVVVATEAGVTGCRCNHTSNFAVLMQIVPFELPEVHKVALSIITYIGCSITLITQFMAITVFTCVGSLNCERVCVHRNLCLAIVGAQVTFLAGIEAVQGRLVCAIVAVLLHYFYTAVFIWMLVEGLHLYSKVVRVFGTEKSRMLYYVCFGWGVPLILVTISAAVDWEGYGTPTCCWLSTQRNTIWAFVGPALAIMIVNLVILVAVIRIVMASAKLDKHGEFDHIRAGVKAAFLLLPLLGLTWIFGLAAVNQQLVVFQYLFALFNTLQGFFIFLFHCAFNSEVRQALKRLQEKRSLQRGDLSSLVGFSTSPSVSPVPSLQDQKKPYGRGDSACDLTAAYKVNRVVPAGYTTTTNIGNNTVPTLPTKSSRERRQSCLETINRSEEMSLMFI